MAFWSDPNLSEPLRQNRWYIQFGNLSNYQYALKSCSKPEYDIGVSEHVLLNHTFRYPKNLVWKPITVKMISVRKGATEEVSLAQAFYTYLNQSYKTPDEETSSENTKTSNLSKEGLNYFAFGNTIKITQIDANGKDIETWELFNTFINNIKFGNLSYDNDGFIDIDLTIQYDYAKLNDISQPAEEGIKRNNFTIFGLDTGINNFLEPRQKKTFTPGFPGDKK